MQGWHIGRAVLDRHLSVLLGRFGNPSFWGVKKGKGVKKGGRPISSLIQNMTTDIFKYFFF